MIWRGSIFGHKDQQKHMFISIESDAVVGHFFVLVSVLQKELVFGHSGLLTTIAGV